MYCVAQLERQVLMAGIQSRSYYRTYTTSTPNATVTTTPEPSTSSTASSNAPTGTTNVSTSSTASNNAPSGTSNAPTATAVAYTAVAPNTEKVSYGSNTANAPQVTTTAPVSSFNNTPSTDPFGSINTVSMVPTPTLSLQDQITEKTNKIYNSIKALFKEIEYSKETMIDNAKATAKAYIEDQRKQNPNKVFGVIKSGPDAVLYAVNTAGVKEGDHEHFGYMLEDSYYPRFSWTYNAQTDQATVEVINNDISLKSDIEDYVKNTITMVTAT